MRIEAISDVHGTLAALEAVLADIAAQSVDVVVNLGDLLSGAVQPRETAERLREPDLPTVRGNHERQLLTFPRRPAAHRPRLTAEIRQTCVSAAATVPCDATAEQGDRHVIGIDDISG